MPECQIASAFGSRIADFLSSAIFFSDRGVPHQFPSSFYLLDFSVFRSRTRPVLVMCSVTCFGTLLYGLEDISSRVPTLVFGGGLCRFLPFGFFNSGRKQYVPLSAQPTLFRRVWSYYLAQVPNVSAAIQLCSGLLFFSPDELFLFFFFSF